MTVQELIDSAFRKIGVISSGQSASTEENTDALRTLNQLVDSWSAQGVPIFEITRTTVTMTGAAAYALPARPTKIRAASVITAAGLQMPARVILAEEWASIPDKTRTGLFAEVLFFDAGFPTSNVYLTPKPGAGSLELQSYFPIDQFATAGETVAFPPGYERSLVAALAVDLAPEYGRTVPPELAAVATEAMQAIAKLNQDAIGGNPPAREQAAQ
jgi:hypothetical protein